MESTADRAIAVVGIGAILPDAPNAQAFWDNVRNGRYSISEVRKERWDPERYYDPDRSAPDKTYSKIGGWVRDYSWEPVKWHLAIPPRVVDAMDEAQKWAIACTREALQDYGYPSKPLDADRTAVILGNAMAGERHYLTALRVFFPEYAGELEASASFSSLPAALRREITQELHDRMAKRLPAITEDSMPGELSNCIAGRIASIFNLHGPNYVVDAACASAMAAISSASEGLIEHDFDAAITGGIDRNMGAPTFVKFCKIGALSATGTRPYAEGADGFVMGEGAAVFLLKRLADAERNGDKIYAVLRGMGGSSDGKGKGITAPNPIGQKFSIERAWQNAGLSPATATYIEGHGTSTAVGDVVEVQSMADVLSSFHLSPGSVAIGSVKSNIGHLKGAAGAAGVLKTVLALKDKVLPPSVHCEHPNCSIDFAHSPLYVNTVLKPWTVATDMTRCAGVSAFGFGGTNFHAVLEEYVPGRINGNGKRQFTARISPQKTEKSPAVVEKSSGVASSCLSYKAPLRGALVIGAPSVAHLMERLRSVKKEAEAGFAPTPAPPQESDLKAPERLAIDYGNAKELEDKCSKALQAFAANQLAVWKALRAQGIYRGGGPPPRVAFLYTGQGSQYVNMLAELRASEPIVGETFTEADRTMAPLLGKPLSEFLFVNPKDDKATAKAEDDLRQTAITQPAVLATDLALTRLLAAYGIAPDMTMGHSLGEYGALVASGALPFEDALEAVSARGREMTRVAVKDNGRMAAVFAPIGEIEGILKMVDGYVVIANINSEHQAVIGGTSRAVEHACEIFAVGGYNVVPLPVSHAFHTSIVAPASEPLRSTLERLHLRSPKVPVVANVNGEFYPDGSDDAVPGMLELLAKQVASPVQFVKGLRTLYSSGARVFVEVGPKKALQGFVEDVLGEHPDVISLFTNHPKNGEIVSFNQALCGLYAAGLGFGVPESATETAFGTQEAVAQVAADPIVSSTFEKATVAEHSGGVATDCYVELGHIFADALERGWKIKYGDNGKASAKPVVVTGASLGLPGNERIFDDSNVARILRGDQFIDLIPARLRQAMVGKHIKRLMKSDNGGPTFEDIANVGDVIKLAGRGGAFDLEQEFGVSAERVAALDRVTALAIAAGLDALRDAGIPLVMRYKTTSKGTQLPDRWVLPESLRDDTGVIFASVFPGFDSLVDEVSRHFVDRERREKLALLESLLARTNDSNGASVLAQEITRHIGELRSTIENEPYMFERRFLFRVLSMGHSQFAEFIGARGPNTQINAACASTTQAVAVAEDWINAGRCRRVVIVSADDITSDHLLEWMGAGFLASGAAATDEVVEDAAIPFDRRRHGMIMGMGAAAMVIETEAAAKERGIQPICEVLSAVSANSAFHGTRLDVEHIGQVMETLIKRAEVGSGISRQEIAPHTVFVSHETYTPARGGSASAEIFALRRVFGPAADQIVIANTKGLTGHAMGTGIEDVVAVKALETGWVPPVANFREVDPDLGKLNLSKGGIYPIEYALRLGAGFGSQISMTLFRWVATKDNVRPNPNALGYDYRIVDPAAWNAWLRGIAGQREVELEVVRHTLRVRAKGLAPRLVEIALEPERLAASVPAQRVDLLDSVIAEAARKSEAAGPKIVEGQTKNEPVPAQAILIEPSRKTQSTDDPVKERVLSLVSVKTGYPADMLDLDLDLEADLGVDTVKQAEVFAAIREFYNIPRDENRKLRDFPTLAHVIRFVHDKRPDLSASDAPAVQATHNPDDEATRAISIQKMPTPDLIASDSVRESIMALVVEKTGYPSEMLDLDLDLEADLGIDTVKQAEMFAAIREMYNIPRDENRKLRDYPTLAHVIRFVYEKRPDLKGAVPTATPATPSPAAPTPEAPKESIAGDDQIKEKVLDIVAEKTGYPKDMLDLDLDLEADLGIDTVKQAEMFASVREAFKIPRDENLQLREFPTLARVIQFAKERIPAHEAPAAPPAGPSKSAPVAEKQTTSTLKSDVGTGAPARPQPLPLGPANAVPRRVPTPNLRPPLNLCKTTGVTLGRGQRVVIMPDQGGVSEALGQELKMRGVDVFTMDQSWPAEKITAQVKAWSEAGSISGVYWLPALDEERSIRTMNVAEWREALRVRVKSLYCAMRALYRQIGEPGTFLMSATKFGGLHGYEKAGATRPLGGAVSGFTKTYKRERKDALVKTLDFPAETSASEITSLLIEEALRDPGAVEIGYKMGLRWTVTLEEQAATDNRGGMALNNDSIFLITGAAGSIVSAITADLAAASGGTFYLLDLVPEPKRSDPDLKRFVDGKEELKRDLFARIQARGERATPALVEKELAALERAVAARNAIDAIEAAGGRAHYFAVDLTDPVAVAGVVEAIREFSGHVDVLLHAAGMERSHFLPDKESREFDLIFDVKCDGWFNLLHAIGEMPLNVAVVFSSIAGRFGNAGQADYSAANDLLCKCVSNFRTTRPQTRGIAIDWTAWNGIGMATRGSIPKLMEAAGIDMLAPEAAIPVIRRELINGDSGGEIVIGQRLGVLMDEWDPHGGLDPSGALTTEGERMGPMIGTIAAMPVFNGARFETTLDPKIQPFLYDHQIEGTPVLPGVMGVEAFAEAALALLPGWNIAAIEDVNFRAPFKFYRNDPRKLMIRTKFHVLEDAIAADCELVGSRTLPNQAEPQVMTHFTGRVRLSRRPWATRSSCVPGEPTGSLANSAEIYRLYFHGPAYQVLEQTWWDGKRMVGRMAEHLPANHVPAGKTTMIEPRLMELCFQTAGLWEMSALGRLGLPLSIEEICLHDSTEHRRGGLFAIVTPNGEGASFDAEVVDKGGNVLLEMRGYRTVALSNIETAPVKVLHAVAV